jgi:hypothetical protein
MFILRSAHFNSGVAMRRHSSLFQFRHGNHTCVFYRSEDSLLEVLTPYIAEGLNRGERCFSAQKPHVGKRLLLELRSLGLNTDDLMRSGALEIHNVDEVYFPDGKFQSRAMIDMLMRSLHESLQLGFPAFRTAGDASWAIEDPNGCRQLLDYEGLVNGYFPGRPAIGLCQYDANTLSNRMLDSVIARHGQHVSDVVPSSPNYSGISVRRGNFWSDIVADKRSLVPNYYYVVQRRRSAEIVGWGVALNFDDAQAESERIAASTE